MIHSLKSVKKIHCYVIIYIILNIIFLKSKKKRKKKTRHGCNSWPKQETNRWTISNQRDRKPEQNKQGQSTGNWITTKVYETKTNKKKTLTSHRAIFISLSNYCHFLLTISGAYKASLLLCATLMITRLQLTLEFYHLINQPNKLTQQSIGIPLQPYRHIN